VGKLREIGIQPDLLICRSDKPLNNDITAKIALFCNVNQSCVLEELDVESTIYEVPTMLAKQGADEIIMERLSLPYKKVDLSVWERVINILKFPEDTIRIAVVGKYLNLQDSYKSLFEALCHGGVANGARVMIDKINSETLEAENIVKILSSADGILVPGGFGMRGINGKIDAIRFARENNVPFLGICLGMQSAVIELARNVCGLVDANSTEFCNETKHPVIHMMEEQKQVANLGGTMRLGSYPCKLVKGLKAYEAYKKDLVFERHRHRYEFNNDFLDVLTSHGLRISGTSPDGKIVEIIEIDSHPWFVAVQFHPEFQSKPMLPHPLFTDFIRMAKTSKKLDKIKPIAKATCKS
jgi:CTP synthase